MTIPGGGGLADQPEVRLRHLGPRAFEHVPPAELAEVMRRTADELGWDDEQSLFRETAGRYGIRRLGTTVRARLSAAHSLMEP